MVVRVDSWESTSLYPNGHSVRVLGKSGEVESEIQTILVENCIQVPPFSEAQVRAGSHSQHYHSYNNSVIGRDASNRVHVHVHVPSCVRCQ